MKKIIYLIFILVLSISITACSNSEGDNEPVINDTVDEKNVENETETLATEFIELMVKEEFSGAVEKYDQAMKEALPENALKDVWKSLISKYGEYIGQERISIDNSLDEYIIVTVTSEFEKSLIDINVVFNKKQEVSGLHFKEVKNASENINKPDETQQHFSEIDVEIKSGDFVLPGTLTIPKGEGPFPAVVLVHGSGPNDRDETIGPNKPFRDLAWGLASKDIAVLRYEKRTKVYGKEIAQNLENFTVYEESIEDAINAVSLLRENEKIINDKIYLLGHSLGGMLVPRISTFDEDIAGFISMAGASRPLEDMLIEQYTYIFFLDGSISDLEKKQLDEVKRQVNIVKNLKDGADYDPKEIVLGAGAKYWIDLNNYKPAEVAKSINRPLLILQGERDYQVTMEDYKIWQNAIGNKENVTFISYAKLNHLFLEGEGRSTPNEYQNDGKIPEYAIEDIAKWIYKTME